MPQSEDGQDSKTTATSARRALVDALHAMHADQRIRVDLALAHNLDVAWNNYDAALSDELRGKNQRLTAALRRAWESLDACYRAVANGDNDRQRMIHEVEQAIAPCNAEISSLLNNAHTEAGAQPLPLEGFE